MKLTLSLLACLVLSSCGYHLVGQGESSVIPQGVRTATLEQNSGNRGKPLLVELQYLWQNDTSLPNLQAQSADVDHVTVRIEQAGNTFVGTGFDTAGLAIQYRLQISGVLNLYQNNALIWQSGMILAHADIFIGGDPGVAEAERERLTEQLEKQWAQDAFARLKSGF